MLLQNQGYITGKLSLKMEEKSGRTSTTKLKASSQGCDALNVASTILSDAVIRATMLGKWRGERKTGGNQMVINLL
jgi:hypothetical protein